MAPVLLLVLSACGQGEQAAVVPAPTPAAGSTPVAAAAVPAAVTVAAPTTLAILNGYLAAWNEHDASRAGSFLDEDSQYFDASFAGLQRGRQAVVDNAIGVFLRGVPDLRWEIRSEPIVSADGIAYEWIFTGTNTGTWGGIAATNQKINLKGISFVRFKNDKITYQAIYYDSMALNKQLGL